MSQRLIVGYETGEGCFCCGCLDHEAGQILEGDSDDRKCTACDQHLDPDDCRMVEGGCDCGNVYGQEPRAEVQS